MAENSAISWTDDTFNPWIGCAKVSPACDGCYAEALMGEGGRFSRAKWGAPGEGEGTRVRTGNSTWAGPRKWNREQEALEHNCRLVGEVAPPRFVFCASLADVFDNAVPPEWRRDLFDLIRATPHLTWLLLTKRPGNIVKMFRSMPWVGDRPIEGAAELRWPRNASIGCTVVNQEEADRDVPKLLAAKAALNPAFAFLSMEPLLGPVDLTRICIQPQKLGSIRAGIHLNALRGHYVESGCAYLGDWPIEFDPPSGPPVGLDWIIAGGETDQGSHKARPADPDWFRSLRDQCVAASVPFHFKQWGEWLGVEELRRLPGGSGPGFGAFDHLPHDHDTDCVRVGKDRDPCTLDGVRHDARPEVRA